MRYCIDTSGFIKGWRYYPPGNFPAVWRDVESLIVGGSLIAPEEVYEELKRGGDDLYDWTCKRNGLFIPHDADIQNTVSAILADPEHAKLLYSQSDATLVVADPFVIASAKVHACTVISGEDLQLSPSPRKTKIPNVCAAMGIEHVSFLEFIQEQGWVY